MYKVYLSNNKIFQGGEYWDSKWNDIPDIGIKRLEYYILGKRIIFEGYEAYNHIIEIPTFFFANGRQQKRIDKVMLMAKDNYEVFKITVNLRTRKFIPNLILFGNEYDGRSITGWKKGIRTIPKYKIQDL